MATEQRPVTIANTSGATGDGPLALRRVVREGPVDVVTADYLAEVNIAWLALEKKQDPNKGYEKSFLRQLDRDTAHIVAEKGIKIIHNGGALNPKGLAHEVEKLLQSYDITTLKIAYVEGDNVIGKLETLQKPGYAPHLDVQGRDLSHVEKPVLSANAYVGMGGIVAALKMGADIIISGRCCDASPVMAAAAWWRGWKETDYDRLSGALLAGHCIECGCYATGGNFSGFKSIPHNWNQGFPIADIAADGTFDISLQEGAHGLVSRDTITAQLVYEIQGPFYLNPDVVADIRDVQIHPKGKNRVSVSGIHGTPPPPTTKLAICTSSGFQLEYYMFAAGLDIAEKLSDLRSVLDEVVPNRKDYTVLRVDQYGTPQPNASSQALATCMFRIFAQAEKVETLSTLRQAIGGYGLGGFCGQHGCMDFRMLTPRPFVSYEPFRVPYSDAEIRVTMGSRTESVTVPHKTQIFGGQVSYDSQDNYARASFGTTVPAPLGSRVHARSGDKGSNANVGFWVLQDDEYAWLRSFLSIERLKNLLGDDYHESYTIERFEIPHLRCVHFLVIGVLEGGISSSYKLDGLAKSFGEFLRFREVDMPKSFLNRGRL
ncbi:duf1446 domain containing protein [Grosmannia clavigera kw1407]|uniref:Duf1446 domain containing protein n=1 Tax=Grosmannia clavigera (strain kw1407 / UAMH 11150) TaxID=655863 RepID=F0XNL5_GROCL|nr:duf1446 domain containing protein [Grosmannia clavigera kw1407]EFX00546.1 duf1446 domain containing protein [Grosmannia clavigera kw1407]